jgi:four helix bundle protein
MIFMKHNFSGLKIWQLARQLVKQVYLITQNYPREELFGLSSQMRRAAVSIPSNIAEGCGRGTDKQLAHFIDIAIGSSCELETQIYLSLDLGYITEEQYQGLNEELIIQRKMMLRFKGVLNK